MDVPTSIGSFQIGCQIGSGYFSKVYKGIYTKTEEPVAIKVILKDSFTDPKAFINFQREVNLLKQCNHPFISQFFTLLEDEKRFYIVMEYCENGSLFDYIQERGKAIEPIAMRYFAEIFATIEYLHKNKRIVHRDLKAENIMFDKYYNVRIIDFGLSNVLSELNPTLYTVCGSPAYVPPEMIRGSSYNSSADIWCLGVILYLMTHGHLPFQGDDKNIMLKNICEKPVEINSGISLHLKDLILQLLEKNPSKRITLENIKKHPWFPLSEYSAICTFVQTTDLFDIDNDTTIKQNMNNKEIEEVRTCIITRDFQEPLTSYLIHRTSKLINDMKAITRRRNGGKILKARSVQMFKKPDLLKYM